MAVTAKAFDAAGSDVVPVGESSYPGGKSGPGIYQRLINLIPRHRILISAFAGQCGVVRNILPAEHTIVIDQDERVCEWWSTWCRQPQGRHLEIHHCDAMEWLKFRFRLTEYSAALERDTAGGGFDALPGNRRKSLRPVMTGNILQSIDSEAAAGDAAEFDGARAARSLATSAAVEEFIVAAEPHADQTEAFIFCDPPYVLSERASGKQYECEMTDDDHDRLIRILTRISSAADVMVCGYPCDLYRQLDIWRSIDHRVPTRGGLQDERIWLNYQRPTHLHDYRYLGNNRRQRERIRRRQKNWLSQLNAMVDREREAMIAMIVNQLPHK